MIVLYLVVILSVGLMLVRPRGIPEVYWIGGGAVVLIACGLISPPLAGRSVLRGLDVYLFLIGMMLISELAREQGLFDWISAAAVNHSRGSAIRLFTLVYGLGVVVTVLMSNDATAVVLTPAILPAIRRARADPLPCLFACVLIANAASFVLPISNPANLVVFHEEMPPLGRWLGWLGVPSILAIVSTYCVLRVIFRRTLAQPTQASVRSVALTGSAKWVLAGLAAMTAVLLIASALKRDLGAPTCLCALTVTGLVSIRYRSNPLRLAREISWSTLALVAGLFVMVGALEQAGLVQITARWLNQTQSIRAPFGTLLAGAVVGVANNLVNNLPLGLVASGTLRALRSGPLLTNAVMIGVDLGPNLSVTGSLATILWLIALRREKVEVSFWQFLRIGAIAMPIALLLALGGLFIAHSNPGSQARSWARTSSEKLSAVSGFSR